MRSATWRCSSCARTPTLPLLSLIVAAQGLLGHGLTSVIGAIPAEILQSWHYGTIFGTLMLAAIADGAAGPWVTGALHDATGRYTLAFWIAIGCSALLALVIWLAAPRRVRAVAGHVDRLADHQGPPKRATATRERPRGRQSARLQEARVRAPHPRQCQHAGDMVGSRPAWLETLIAASREPACPRSSSTGFFKCASP